MISFEGLKPVNKTTKIITFSNGKKTVDIVLQNETADMIAANLRLLSDACAEPVEVGNDEASDTHGSITSAQD